MDINTLWFFFFFQLELNEQLFPYLEKKYSPESFALERTKAD